MPALRVGWVLTPPRFWVGCRRRRDALVSAAAGTMPGAGITGLGAGHHALLRLPHGVDQAGLVADARETGVAVRGVGDYRVVPDDEAPGDPLPPALVIGSGNVSTRQIRESIDVLSRIVAARSS